MKNKYLGIDLGTTNSALAIFEDGVVRSILNDRGDLNTPSVVRVTKNGIVVGNKAKKHLYNDTKNTFKEFKRVIGTRSLSKPDLNDKCWSSAELSAEVLKHLKKIAEEQEKIVFDKVVITVPALFELPQINATAEAARLAGFEKVELIPEPVASGLAAGWDNAQQSSIWLVYDLGGGTFDVSLLESRDGLLRVVGHDGDNFLGGRDIDRCIVNWITSYLEKNQNLSLNVNHPDYSSTIRFLEEAAETAKIRLSTTPQTLLELEFEYDGEYYELDIEFSGAQLKELCLPIIQKSSDICKRLVQSHGLELDRLNNIVLVGGPAHMPIIQELVSEQIASIVNSKEDPMSLVAKGAAIYAATINLGCNSELGKTERSNTHQVWLQYPCVCTELNPTIMGRIIDKELVVDSISISNLSGSWTSGIINVDESGLFIVEVCVKPATKNSFNIQAFDKKGEHIAMSYQDINIVHGLTMSDPPLSRSIGIALADGSVKSFIERGTPLPAKRTFIQNTVSTLIPQSNMSLDIPIVQGERRQSRFCRKVGTLSIQSNSLKTTLNVGSAIEITIEVDRGGDLKAHALIADQGIVIEGVAQLIMNSESPEIIKTQTHSLNNRLAKLMQTAFREKNEKSIVAINPLIERAQEIIRELHLIENDIDACQKISRNLMEIEAETELFESRDQLSELMYECEQSYFQTCRIVNEFGDSTDQNVLKSCASQMENAFNNTRQGEIERLIERLEQVYRSAHSKSPSYWKDLFLSWASYIHVATNPKKAKEIVDKGYRLIEKEEHIKLKSLTLELFDMIPNQYKNNSGIGSYESGIY